MKNNSLFSSYQIFALQTSSLYHHRRKNNILECNENKKKQFLSAAIDHPKADKTLHYDVRANPLASIETYIYLGREHKPQK